MDEFHKALGDISNIRKQVANATEFRGYGPATLTMTGAIALGASFLQHAVLADPLVHPIDYLTVWVATAITCAGLTGWQVYTRSRRIHSQLSEEMIRMAAEQFLPALAVGMLLTVVVVLQAPQIFWALPGLWQMVFSLGVFASCRFLPKPMVAAAIWYLFTGLGCLALGDARALSPWMMGVPFGVGQALIALVLYLRNSEAGDEA